MKKYRCFLLLFLSMVTFLSAASSQKGSSKRPNILIFIVDEWRFPTGYESDELKEWLAKNLTFQNAIASKGYVFHNHYTNTNACSPARATLHTGHYPNIHGVTQTGGLAKQDDSLDLTWLQPFTVPTMGNYLQVAGYKTILKGKWHVTHASITLPSGTQLTTYDVYGNPIPEYTNFYLKKNVLHDFGYDGWIGPEPHGFAPLNSGSSVEPPAIGRDAVCSQQAIDELEALSKEKKPWLLVASFANVHDIAVYGVYARQGEMIGTGWDFPIDETLPKQLFTKDFECSFKESLDGKPEAQLNYRDLFAKDIQPIVNMDRFQRYYYTIQKTVDQEMKKVWDKLVSSPMYENTIILFVSDHGELLGSHGKMVQKWHQAYQEAIHVPLIISSPLFGNTHRDIYELTSHIDIMPTVLDFAKVDVESVRDKLGEKFSLNLPISGKSLSPLLKNPKAKTGPLYFYTEDEPTKGSSQYNILCKPYEAVKNPCSVEAVLAYIDGDLWKITRYYFPDESCVHMSKNTFEMYNVTKDPMELTSLHGNSKYLTQQNYLTQLMNEYRVRHRVVFLNSTIRKR